MRYRHLLYYLILLAVGLPRLWFIDDRDNAIFPLWNTARAFLVTKLLGFWLGELFFNEVVKGVVWWELQLLYVALLPCPVLG